VKRGLAAEPDVIRMASELKVDPLDPVVITVQKAQ
jgi:hypothetical protein